jgi:hypothetical protein
MTTKTFNLTLSQIHSARPATKRVLVEISVSGDVHISSTTEEEDTINILDKAMEAIDGQRLPPTDA